jgi:hypothetical protein
MTENFGFSLLRTNAVPRAMVVSPSARRSLRCFMVVLSWFYPQGLRRDVPERCWASTPPKSVELTAELAEFTGLGRVIRGPHGAFQRALQPVNPPHRGSAPVIDVAAPVRPVLLQEPQPAASILAPGERDPLTKAAERLAAGCAAWKGRAAAAPDGAAALEAGPGGRGRVGRRPAHMFRRYCPPTS